MMMLLNSLKHPKSGYEHGAVRLAREEIDRINQFPTPSDYLSYERDKLPDPKNPSHGNIIFKKGLSQRFNENISRFPGSKIHFAY